MAVVDNNPPQLNPLPDKVFPWHQLFRRLRIVQVLEAVQDLIAVSLCVGLCFRSPRYCRHRPRDVRV